MDGLKMQMYMKRLSMREVAKKIGVHPVTLGRWLKNCNSKRYDKIINAINELDKKKVNGNA